MSKSVIDDLKSYLTQLRDEDLIWVLFVYNRPDIHRSRKPRDSSDAIEKDIAEINSLDKLKNIIKIIIDKLYYQDEDNIYYFLQDLKDFKSNIRTPPIEYNKIQNNYRLLEFFCKIMINELRDRKFSDINNPYFRFIYIAYTTPKFNGDPRAIENIYNRFDAIYSKFNSHFKSTSPDFFIWAKNYINENSEFRRYRRNASHVSEYENLINSIFDLIYYEDENIHYALKKKLSNAWYQKKHREENKVKKPNYYGLTKRAKEALLTLAFKYGVTEEQMIERLINESYTKECCSTSGENLYL